MRGKIKMKMTSLMAAIFLMTIAIAYAPPPSPAMSAPAVTDTTLGPGTSFSIDISAENVEDLWGYELLLTFDPTVLTAISYAYYAPFVVPWPQPPLPPGYDFVSIAASMLFGTTEGVSGNAPLASITFDVITDGDTLFDLQDTILMDTDGNPIGHDALDGYFANTAEKFGLEIQRVYPEHKKWSESADPDNTITARIKNTGTAEAEAQVIFSFMDRSGAWTHSEIIPVTVAAGEKTDVSMTIDRVWLILRGAPPPVYGQYHVSVKVLWRAAVARGTRTSFTLSH